jgi:hypothetical protein
MRFAPTAAVAFALISSGTVFAHDEHSQDRVSRIESQLLQGVVREGDVSLFLDYLRAAMLAAAEGREPPPPPKELERRAEELSSELKARGTLAALLLLSALEEKTKALLREGAPPSRQALPPVVPYVPITAE